MSLVVRSTDVEQAGAPALVDQIDIFKRQRRLRIGLTYAERLAALNALSDGLMTRDSEVAQVLPAAGLAFAAAFLRSSNLEHLVARELLHPEALDGFVRVDQRKSLRVVPQGTACHWVAGNVPLLGLFSWALSALVGNLNIVRPSSRGEDFMSPILRLLSRTSAGGQELADDTLVAVFPREDHQSHQAMSTAANVRIAWGGQEAVESVMALPSRWDCETIVLGPRMSLAVVDPVLATTGVLSRLASDVAYFDQQACSSPQWVFVKSGRGSDLFDGFVESFAEAFAAQARGLGRHPIDAGETYRIELDRARVLLEGGVLRRDHETAWTVAVLDAPDTRVVCANRFVQVIPFADVLDICTLIPANVQTAVTLLDGGDTERFTEAAVKRGVCRFPRPGEGNHFENPWDGIPLISRLTRWAVRTEPRD